MDSPRILVIRPGALGDTVFTEPVVAAIRERYPTATIELAGRTEYLPLLVGEGLADACVSTDSAGFTSLFSGGPLELPDLDIVIAFLPDPDGSLTAKLAAHSGKAVVFDPRPNEAGAVHIVDHLLAALEPLGVAAVRSHPDLDCRDEWRKSARLLLRDRDYAVVHPGSGGRAKLWLAERWAAVMSALAPLEVALTCGPADGEAVDDVLAHIAERSRIAVVRDQPLTTVAGVLAGAKLYLGCDSGVTHLAAALGVPTVALFGPSDPRTWAPRGENVRLVVGPARSMKAVTVSQVIDTIQTT